MATQGTKIESNSETIVMFLSSILDKAKSYTNHIDLQINILVGLCSGLLIVSLPRLQDGVFKTPLIILIFAVIVALFTCILAIHPPRFMRKRDQEESLLYNKKITSFDSAHTYAERLTTAIDSPEEIINQFALEIYNSYKYYYQPPRSFFKLARSFVVYGLAISLTAYLFALWNKF